MKKVLILICVFCLHAYPLIAASLVQVPIGNQPDLLEDELDDFLDDEEYELEEIYDPLEPLNRVFFEFNDKLYFWVLKPVKVGYTFVVPWELRQCFGNFFNNLAAPVRLINNILQGRFEDAGIVLSRFLINTTLGVGGLGDVARSEFELEPRLADFGQTLGGYGVGEGIYINWPILGPSNLRDTFGIVGDSFVHPVYQVDMTFTEFLAYYSTNKVNALSLAPNIYEDMKKYSLDPYAAMRQAFYDYRRNAIRKVTDEENDF